MDAFSYLSVLLSIILGLAIQQVLLGYRALLLSRRHVRFYPLPLIWSVLLLTMVVQHWWASFGLAGHDEWTFADFATTLVLTALIYMLTAVVLPDIPPDKPLDLKDHYFRESRAFYILSMLAVAWSAGRELVLEDRLPEPGNMMFHVLFFAASAVGASTKRERVHQAITLLMTVAFGFYILLLFAELKS